MNGDKSKKMFGGFRETFGEVSEWAKIISLIATILVSGCLLFPLVIVGSYVLSLLSTAVVGVIILPTMFVMPLVIIYLLFRVALHALLKCIKKDKKNCVKVN